MRSAGVYCRISRDRDGLGLGVERQRRECVEMVERNGWTLVEVFVDDDTSAFSGRRRPGYERLLAAVDAGVVDAVVAWHPDRLHRSPRELEDFVDVVERSGAHVATVAAGEYDLGTPAGRTTARIIGAVARGESEHKADRLKLKHAELARAGKVSGGGRRPFGYEADRVTIRPDEAALIRDAVERILAGDSLRSITNDWRARKVPTVTGTQWSPTTVRRLLRSGRISGQREHRGEIVGPAVWPAIVSPEQTRRVRALLDDPNRDRATGSTRTYMLTGFLRCGRRDARMSTRPTGKGVPRYVCPPPDRGGCGRCGIASTPLEQLIVDAVMLRVDTPAFAQAMRQRTAEAGADDLAREAADLEARLEQLAADHYADGLIGRREFLAAREPLVGRLEAVRRQLAHRTADDALVGVGALAERWDDLGLDRRRAVLGALIELVVIAPTTRGNNRFDPERVDVRWRF